MQTNNCLFSFEVKKFNALPSLIHPEEASYLLSYAFKAFHTLHSLHTLHRKSKLYLSKEHQGKMIVGKIGNFLLNDYKIYKGLTRFILIAKRLLDTFEKKKEWLESIALLKKAIRGKNEFYFPLKILPGKNLLSPSLEYELKYFRKKAFLYFKILMISSAYFLKTTFSFSMALIDLYQAFSFFQNSTTQEDANTEFLVNLSLLKEWQEKHSSSTILSSLKNNEVSIDSLFTECSLPFSIRSFFNDLENLLNFSSLFPSNTSLTDFEIWKTQIIYPRTTLGVVQKNCTDFLIRVVDATGFSFPFPTRFIPVSFIETEKKGAPQFFSNIYP